LAGRRHLSFLLILLLLLMRLPLPWCWWRRDHLLLQQVWCYLPYLLVLQQHLLLLL
jgi:hypothetical protein